MKLVRVSDCCGVRLCSIEFDYVRLLDRSITERSIAFDGQNFFVSSIKFDHRTQSNPIERLGSIGFDWVRLPNVRLATPGPFRSSFKTVYVTVFCGKRRVLSF